MINKDDVQLFLLLGIVFINCFFMSMLYIKFENIHDDVQTIRAYDATDSMFSKDLIDDTAGRYFVDTQNIALYTKGTSPYTALDIAKHEIGHYVWYEYWSDNLREKYTQIYVNSNDFVSDYAKTTVEEDFSETFMTSITCTMDVSRVPADRQYMFKEYVEKYIN